VAVGFGGGAVGTFSRGDVNGDGDADATITDVNLLSHEWPASLVDEYVDLGLGSGTLWATHNLGATNPEDYGDYFAWGEIVPNKETYTWATTAWVYYENGSLHFSKYNTDSQYGEIDNKTELDPEDDAATANMGPEWRMPTRDEITELVENCTWEWTELNGVNGYQVTGPNGNSIFLPAAGESAKYSIGVRGCYWSSSMSFIAPDHYFPTNANNLYFASDVEQLNGSSRFMGCTVRAVRVTE